MNAGRDLAKARRHAQANANNTGETWVLTVDYSGCYWIERDWPTRGTSPMSNGGLAEAFEPARYAQAGA